MSGSSILSPVLTVDGPSGAGKGTLTKQLAAALGWHLLDSGAMYRVLALASLNKGIPLDNAEQVVAVSKLMQVSFLPSKDLNSSVDVILDGSNVTSDIRTEHCGNAASKIAALPPVRAALLDSQRNFRKSPGLVADGRDMGTVVFPDAKLKFFLTASPEERAKRRYIQLKQKGDSVSLADLVEEIKLRDERDQTRSASPLTPASDAIVIDSSTMTIQQVLDAVLAHVGRQP